MWKPKTKKGIVALAILLVAMLGICLGSSVVYWHYALNNAIRFKTVGISAQLIPADFSDYQNLVQATGLTNGEVAVSILKENYNAVWLNVSSTCNATGIQPTVSCVGQYYMAYVAFSGGANLNVWQPCTSNSSTFTINMGTQQTIAKKWMMYTQPSASNYSAIGYALVLNFTYSSEAMAPGNYGINLLFSMGFVG